MFWKKSKPVDGEARLWLVGAFAGAMVLNGLAGSSTVLGGVDTAAVSDSFPNLFAPSGVTFAIWGVIYTLIVGFILYTFGIGRPVKSAMTSVQLNTVMQLLTYNLVLNGIWILVWQYKIIWLSVVLMIGILFTLIRILDVLRRVEVRGLEYALVRLPFSVYFGWITVATVANVTTWLISIKWDGAGIREGVWIVAVLMIAAAIGIITALRNRDWAYLAVFVWAYAGILLKHLSPHGFAGMYPSTIITLTILLAVLLTMTIQLAREQFSVSTKR
ncbi:MAG: hypothetical protein WAU02_03300 [Candidatus Saccharimonadales bacterium]